MNTSTSPNFFDSYDTPVTNAGGAAKSQLHDVLRLIRSENIGCATFYRLLRQYGTAAQALDSVPHLAARGGRQIRLFSEQEARAELESIQKHGARFISFQDTEYPSLLHVVPDAPPLLAVLGHAHILQSKPCIAIVGARNASANGCQFAHKLAYELGQAGYVVVSGLARGVDGYAHRGALATGTVAVIAGGVDTQYPPEHKNIYQQMQEQGVIVSEQPFGKAPHQRSFPARNRIIAGMSVGVIVVEATLKSGSLITADYAADYGREVFAVPGSPLDPRSKGVNNLLRHGATMVESAEDVIEALQREKNILYEHAPPPTALMEQGAVTSQPPAQSDLDQARDAVVPLLSYEAVSSETLLQMAQVPARLFSIVLLELELAGRLVRHSGGRVSLLSGL